MRSLLSQDWLPHVEAIYCSAEQKAVDGAAILAEARGLPVHCVDALGENDRSATGYLPKREFEATADAFFAQSSKSIRGWERAIDAQTRIIGAVERLVSTTPGTGSIVIVSHGGVGALLLCHLKGVSISRTEEQPGSTGGNYFCFHMPERTLAHGWKPIELSSSLERKDGT
jgi:broad specificity phosphatase PhoE